MLSRESFREMFAATLAGTNPAFRVKARLPFGLALINQEGREHTFFFDRAYEAYLRAPETLTEILNEVAAPIVCDVTPDTKSYASVRSFLLPLLKPPSYEQVVRTQMDQAKVPEEARPIIGRMHTVAGIVYAIDLPNHPERLLVSPADLKNWKVSQEEVHGQSVDNLGKKSKIVIQKSKTAAAGEFMVLDPRDSYSASRILLPALLIELTKNVGEDVVIAIPSQNLFFAIGSCNQKGIDWMRTELVSKHFRESPQAVTDRLFVFRAIPKILEVLPEL